MEIACDDGNPCTADGCDADTGCWVETMPDYTPCPDGECHDGECGPARIRVLCVANGFSGSVVCFDETGTEVQTFHGPTNPLDTGSCLDGCSTDVCPGVGDTCPEAGDDPLVPTTATAIVEHGDHLYVSANNLCHLLRIDRTERTMESFPMCFSVSALTINGMDVSGDELLLVSHSGGMVLHYDVTEPALPTPSPARIAGLDGPSGFVTAPDGEYSYVIVRTRIYRLRRTGPVTWSRQPIFDLTEVDPTHTAAGGLAIVGDDLFYTIPGPDFGEGLVIAVDLETRTHRIVTAIPENPLGLAADPSGVWLYVTRQTIPPGQPGCAIDRILLSSIDDESPHVENWVPHTAALQGPFGLVWTSIAE